MINLADEAMTIKLDYDLPEYPKFEEGYRRAPRRESHLTEADKALAIKNALRYIHPDHHEQMAKEFAAELEEHGRIYGYRFRPEGKLYGNTEYVATLISRKTGGDLFQIKTATPYPGTHKALIDAAKKEQEAKARPKLTTHIKNLDDYTTIFIGFPNWWYDMPMPLYSFFDEYDFTGKTLIPFCTHGGSRFSQTEKTIATLEKGATMVKGLSISRNSVDRSEETINKWLQRLGFNN